MVMTKASMSGEDRGGKPNPGTKKDKRISGNKRADNWAQDLANKSGGLPSKTGPVDTSKK